MNQALTKKNVEQSQTLSHMTPRQKRLQKRLQKGLRKRLQKRLQQRPRQQQQQQQQQRLLPVMKPAQNMREIIKQCIMLEDHLVQSKKRCPDCTSKHMLAIEALAEECGSLCGDGHCDTAKQAHRVAQQARVLHHTWASNPKDEKTCRLVAAKLRMLRKKLMKQYAVLPVRSLPSNEQHAVARLAGRRFPKQPAKRKHTTSKRKHTTSKRKQTTTPTSKRKPKKKKKSTKVTKTMV